jgi:hypothetical protein
MLICHPLLPLLILLLGVVLVLLVLLGVVLVLLVLLVVVLVLLVLLEGVLMLLLLMLVLLLVLLVLLVVVVVVVLLTLSVMGRCICPLAHMSVGRCICYRRCNRRRQRHRHRFIACGSYCWPHRPKDIWAHLHELTRHLDPCPPLVDHSLAAHDPRPPHPAP